MTSEDEIMVQAIHSELSKGKNIFIIPIITDDGYTPFITNSISEYIEVSAENRNKIKTMKQVEEMLSEI
ncbi:MAG: hypothetical protein WC389_20045 [Lutibacter sp.]|jgi:hypothetical protein